MRHLAADHSVNNDTMQHTSATFADLVRALNDLSDRDLGLLSLKSDDKGCCSIKIMPVATHRCIGSQPVSAGTPFGLTQDDKGLFSLQQVALVRHYPDNYVVIAHRIIKRNAVKQAVISAICGIAAAAAALGIYHFIQNPSLGASQAITAPCLISKIDANAVVCIVGVQQVSVAVGQSFPDNRYRLDAVIPDKNGFQTTRLRDRHSVVFQVDPQFFTNLKGK
jgi:hypothetical protein